MLKENEDNIVWREGIADIDKWLVIARAMMSFPDAILLDFQNIMINELSNTFPLLLPSRCHPLSLPPTASSVFFSKYCQHVSVNVQCHCAMLCIIHYKHNYYYEKPFLPVCTHSERKIELPGALLK